MLGKLIGGIAGLAWGGPFGAVVGAALGHAADTGTLPGQSGFAMPGRSRLGLDAGSLHLQQARMAALLGQRDHAFAIHVVVLSAKLAKCDGVVNRAEIDAFKRQFRVPAGSAGEVGRMFDQARDGADSFEPYALQLGKLFADTPDALEDVLAALFQIARADGALSAAEQEFLIRTHAAFGLDRLSWDRARGASPRRAAGDAIQDPYAVLGLTRSATDESLRVTWKSLMRENHPDSLASRGAAPELIAGASDRVARINAAWDQIKRERGL
jgi:DnaJ like chaperone protein